MSSTTRMSATRARGSAGVRRRGARAVRHASSRASARAGRAPARASAELRLGLLQLARASASPRPPRRPSGCAVDERGAHRVELVPQRLHPGLQPRPPRAWAASTRAPGPRSQLLRRARRGLRRPRSAAGCVAGRRACGVGAGRGLAGAPAGVAALPRVVVLLQVVVRSGPGPSRPRPAASRFWRSRRARRRRGPGPGGAAGAGRGPAQRGPGSRPVRRISEPDPFAAASSARRPRRDRRAASGAFGARRAYSR